jgi:hypothetical protein
MLNNIKLRIRKKISCIKKLTSLREREGGREGENITTFFLNLHG